jgi:hypothetical protein
VSTDVPSIGTSGCPDVGRRARRDQAGTVVISGADFDYSLDRDHWYRRGVERVDFHIAQRVS